MQKKILNVRFDKTTLQGATDLILKWTKTNFQKMVFTPNPEMLLAAAKDPEFLKILNNSDLNIPDGIGILWAAKYRKISKGKKSLWKWFYSLASIPFYPKFVHDPLPERVSGSDLMLEICKHSDSKIFLLGAGPGVGKAAGKKLQKRFKNIKIAGHYEGSPKIKDEKEIIAQINKVKPKILFVAYGAPAQETWIARNLQKMPTVKVAMGIGGSFDFIAGKRKRAPKWMQKLGLEWLARIIQEPSRRKRIYNATIKFPLNILKS